MKDLWKLLMLKKKNRNSVLSQKVSPLKTENVYKKEHTAC